MIEESLYKTSFLGRDGFRWWIGQIPPIESQKGQANGSGWGNRIKVRILGYHPYSTVELSNDDLPWAQILMSPNTGSGAANYASNHKLRPGDVVFGFFLDGDNGQLPVITGIFGRTDQVPSKKFTSPFAPYTGYTERIPSPEKTLYASEAIEDKKNSQKSPRDLPPEKVQEINGKSKYKDELYYYSGVGKKIIFANSSADTLAKGIGAEIENVLQKVNDVTNKITNITSEISRTVDKIIGIANGFVSQTIFSLYSKLIPLFQQGLDLLYKTVFAKVLAATQNPAIAHAAGVAAQTAMIGPVKLVQSQIPKLFGTVVNRLFGVVTDMVTDVVSNVKHFKSCVADQFVGSLLNHIIGKIESVISGPLQGVSKILSAAFSVADFLRSGVSAVRAINGLFNTFQNKNKSVGNVEEWTIGVGIVDAGDDKSKFENILSNMNSVVGATSQVANTAKGVVDNVTQGWDIFSSNTSNKKSKSKVGGCFTAEKDNGSGGCSAPKVKIFGGSGKGAKAKVIMGSFDKNSKGMTTGSVIGVKVIKKGKRYKYPPFVEIVDECGLGYGAVARSVINEKGEVIKIYIVSEGENYPVSNTNININDQLAETEPSEIPNYISDVYILEPGYNYSPNDIATDNYGNDYTISVDEDGSILGLNIMGSSIKNTTTLPDDIWLSQIIDTTNTKVVSDGASDGAVTELVSDKNKIQSTLLNRYIIVDDLPTITIQSETGSGAVFKPILDKLPVEEIQKLESQLQGTKYIKDCID